MIKARVIVIIEQKFLKDKVHFENKAILFEIVLLPCILHNSKSFVYFYGFYFCFFFKTIFMRKSLLPAFDLHCKVKKVVQFIYNVNIDFISLALKRLFVAETISAYHWDFCNIQENLYF